MILRPCSRPGCSNLVSKGCCEEHRPTRDRSDKKRFYDSRRWRDRIRPAQLRREPLCELNETCEHPTPAEHVHHIDGDTSNNHPSNLQSVCRACHTWIENHDGALSRNGVKP